jgi:hypothetical protein
VDAVDIKWVRDASSSFGIGVLVGHRWAQFKLKKGWKAHLKLLEKGGIAWAETAAIRLGMLIVSKIRQVQGKKFIVFTNNTTSESVVTKHRSRDRAVNKEWKKIQSLLVLLKCNIEAMRVTSAHNDADELLRGIGKRLKMEDCVVIGVPDDLTPVLQQSYCFKNTD